MGSLPEGLEGLEQCQGCPLSWGCGLQVPVVAPSPLVSLAERSLSSGPYVIKLGFYLYWKTSSPLCLHQKWENEGRRAGMWQSVAFELAVLMSRCPHEPPFTISALCAMRGSYPIPTWPPRPPTSLPRASIPSTLEGWETSFRQPDCTLASLEVRVSLGLL